MKKRPPQMQEAGASPKPGMDAALPFRWRLVPLEEGDPEKAVWALRERIKELNCLYAIAQLAESDGRPFSEILNVIAATIIPPSWQFPEITCARITIRDDSHMSPDFEFTPWHMSSPVRIFGEVAGEVTVCYLEDRPPAFEGPFLHEERVLLDAIAERIGAISMRLSAEKDLQETNHQLMMERQTLQETNTALRTLMARIEEEKKETCRDIRDNVEKVIKPILSELLISITDPQKKYVQLLQDSLEELTSPFIGSLARKFCSLTPTEIQICSMIRSGLRTKEIARLRGISPATVHRHRERIRGKLGIVNSDTNLITFLRMEMEV